MVEFLKALPVAASSPLAFAAYAVALAAWTAIAWRIKRNKQVLAYIDRLPSRDRLRALEDEMGTTPREVSPEAWVRLRIHRYYLTACIVLITLLLALLAITTTVRPNATTGQVVSDVTLTATAVPDEKEPCKVSYMYERHDKLMIVRQDVPYLDKIRAGRQVRGGECAFTYEYPSLSFKIDNNTNATLVLSELLIQVAESTFNNEPVLTVEEGTNGYLAIVNEGWGHVVDPKLRFTAQQVDYYSRDTCGFKLQPERFEHSVAIETFLEDVSVPFTSYLRAGWSCVVGELIYSTDTGGSAKLLFGTALFNGPPLLGAVLTISERYVVFLEAGKSNYTKRVPIAQYLPPAGVDNFAVSIATDRSATFELKVSCIGTGPESKRTFCSDEISLEVFIPRRAARYDKHKELPVVITPSARSVPPSILLRDLFPPRNDFPFPPPVRSVPPPPILPRNDFPRAPVMPRQNPRGVR